LISGQKINLGSGLILGLIAIVAASAPASDWNHPPDQKIPGVQHSAFHSASMKVDVGFNIYLPPGYASRSAERFPVIYYLHGIKGHESSYLGYAQLLNRAIESKAIRPVILVFANGGPTSFFSDSPDHSIMGETVIVRELIPHIDANFRTIASGSARALHGFSMGGSGALKIGFKFPEMFCAIVTYDALLSDAMRFRAEEKKLFTKIFGDDAGFARNDPFTLLPQHRPKLQNLAIQIVVADDEREVVQGNRKLHSALEAAKVPHDFKELPGVSHKKEQLFEKAALPAFEFTDRAFQRKAR
jgi:enterochelin esterase-like enzyme